MDDRNKIKKIFLKYVDILEKDNIDELDDILADDILFESTNYGEAKDKDEVKKILKWQGMEINYSRYKIFNFVVFVHDDKAIQSAVVTSLVGINNSDYFHYFQFGGYYLNEYKKVNGKWKITNMKFNLDMEDGNTLIVKDWWNLIDYRYFEGTRKYPIISELNNPWIRIPVPDSLGSEEEQVLDSYYRYSWGIDHADFGIFQTCLGDKIQLFNYSELLTREEVIQYMKFKRFKEATMEHIWKIDSVKIEGNEAILKSRRYEPHRMGTTKLNKENMNLDFYTGSFEYKFIKKEGTDYINAGWKMISNKMIESKIISEPTYDKQKFF